MPDVTAPEAPKVKVEDVLLDTRQKVDKAVITGAVGNASADSHLGKIGEATPTMEAMKKARMESPTNLKDSLTATQRVNRFTEVDFGNLKTKLEAGSNARVGAAATRIESLVKYAEGARTADEQGSEVNRIIEGASGSAEWLKIRTEVANLILRDGNLAEKFPGIGDMQGPEQIAFIEEVLARDPRFQDAVTTELSSIFRDAKDKMKDDPKALELNRAKEAAKRIDDVQKEQLDAFKQRLKDLKVPEDQLQKIDTMLNTGEAESVADISIELVLAAAKAEKTIPEPKFIAGYMESDSAINEAQKEVDRLNKLLGETTRLPLKNGLTLEQKQAQIENVTNERNAKAQKITDATRLRDNNKRTYLSTYLSKEDDGTDITPEVAEARFAAQILRYKEIQSIKDTTNGLNRNIQFLVRNAQALRTAEDKVSEIKAANPDMAARDAQQEKDKEELVKRLENLAATATGNFMAKKYEDYVTDQKILLDASIKDAEAKGEKWISEKTKLIKERMEKWQKMDSNHKIVRDKDAIGQDIKEYAYHTANGKDGIKYIMAREVGYEMDKTKAKDELANNLAPGLSYDQLSPTQKVQVDADYDKQTKDFDKIVTEHGANYKKNLVANFLAARGMNDRTLLGKELGALALKPDEWTTVYKSLKSEIDTELKDNPNAKKIMDRLKKQGIEPDSKMKWLIWLAIIFGLGALAVFGALPIASGILAAAPVVGKGVGGTLVHGLAGVGDGGLGGNIIDAAKGATAAATEIVP